MAETEFEYEGNKINIQCDPNEQMSDIINKFNAKTGTKKEDLQFVAEGKDVKENETFKSQYKLKRKVSVLVNKISKEIKDSLKKSNYIICPNCKGSSQILFNNYKIELYGCKNGHETKDISINDFGATQNYDEAKIICQKCQNVNKYDAYKNIFYICLDCKQNLCPLCQSTHEKQHNIINYDDKNFTCYLHFEPLTSYCQDCKKDICAVCESEHEGHKIITYGSILPNIKKIKEETAIFKDKIGDFKKEMEELINKLNQLIESFDNYFHIYEDITDAINIKKRNYSLIQNIHDVLKFNNTVMQDINQLISDKKIYSNNINRLYAKIYLPEEMQPNEIKETKEVKSNEEIKQNTNAINNEYSNYTPKGNFYSYPQGNQPPQQQEYPPQMDYQQQYVNQIPPQYSYTPQPEYQYPYTPQPYYAHAPEEVYPPQQPNYVPPQQPPNYIPPQQPPNYIPPQQPPKYIPPSQPQHNQQFSQLTPPSEFKNEIYKMKNKYGMSIPEEQIDQSLEEAKSKKRMYLFPEEETNYIRYDEKGKSYISSVHGFKFAHSDNKTYYCTKEDPNSYDGFAVRLIKVSWLNLRFKFNHVKPGNYKLFLNQCFENNHNNLQGQITFKLSVCDKNIYEDGLFPNDIMIKENKLSEIFIRDIKIEDFDKNKLDRNGDGIIRLEFTGNDQNALKNGWIIDGARLLFV